MAARRIVGSVDAVAVQRPRARLGEVAVPHLVGVLGQRDPRELAPAARVEDAQLDLLGVGAEQREVHPLTVPRRAQRVRQPGLDARLRRDHGASQIAESAGSVSVSENGRPCEGWADAVTEPPLPTSEPPYAAASV